MTEEAVHSHTHTALLHELGDANKDLRSYIPSVFQQFGALSSASLEDGTLSRKMKELLALAMAVAQHCDGCIASHARGAAKAGATPEEVAETLGVAILLMGGPGTVYAANAWKAFREFSETAPQ